MVNIWFDLFWTDLDLMRLAVLLQEEAEGEGDELLPGGSNLAGRRGALVPPKMLVTGDSGRESSLSRSAGLG